MVEFLIAAGVSWFFGSLGYFIFVFLMALFFPKTLQVFVYGCLGPMMWGGSAIILYIIGALFDVLPPGESGLTTAAMITAIPAILFVHYIARSVWTVNPNTWKK